MSKKTTMPRTGSQEKLRVSSNIMRALAHPLRIRMLQFIDTKGTAFVNEIYEAMDIEQSIASQHLRILRQSNLVFTRREQKFVFYSVNYAIMQQATQAASIMATFVNA
jgi:ArsR family transcriptional regulator